jgi:hypothetical protein
MGKLQIRARGAAAISRYHPLPILLALAAMGSLAQAKPISAYYPKAALTDHQDGEATLMCGRSERGALQDCRLLEERPGGQGFGDAALALAAKSANGCGPPLPPSERVVRPIRFTFRASAADIEPDPRRSGWALTSPKWKERPSRLARYDPPSPYEDLSEGEAVLQCVVGADGGLKDCGITQESPKKAGFAEVATKLSRRFVTDLHSCGRSVVGATVVIPIQFKAPED